MHLKEGEMTIIEYNLRVNPSSHLSFDICCLFENNIQRKTLQNSLILEAVLVRMYEVTSLFIGELLPLVSCCQRQFSW